MKSRLFLVSLLLLLVSACTIGPRIHYNSDPKADFSKYKTFNFMPAPPGQQTEQYQSFTERFLRDAIEKELLARGMSKDETNPDMLVNFYIHTKEKVSSTTSPSMSMGYYGYRGRYGYSYGFGYGTDTTVRQYTEGTLNIDLVDAAQNNLVWEGLAIGTVSESDRGKVQEKATDAVQRIFNKYPVKPLLTQAN